MSNIKRISTLAKIITGQIGRPTEFSDFNDVDIKEQYKAEVNKFFTGKNWYRDFQDNQRAMFRILEESIEADLPKEVMDKIGMFANVMVLEPGDTKEYTFKRNKGNIRKTVVEVAKGGRLKHYKMDKGSMKITTHAVGTAVGIEKDELRRKFLDFNEFKDEAQQGIQDRIYEDVHIALKGVIDGLPAANKSSASGFDKEAFDDLIAKAKSYGDEVKIICTERFASTIEFPANDQQSIAEVRTNGHVKMYKGCPIHILPNSIKAPYSSEWVFSNETAFFIPTAKDEKFLQVALEGTTSIKEKEDDDTDESIFEVTADIGVICIVPPPYLYAYTNTKLA